MQVAGVFSGEVGTKSLGKNIKTVSNDFVLIPSGTFIRGNTFEAGMSHDRPTHEVTLTRSFFMSKYELTFDEYDAYCDAIGEIEPSDEGWGRGKRPVIYVSWYNALAYCNWRSQNEGLEQCYTIVGNIHYPYGIKVTFDYNKNGYRLPTEAEWEYAASGAFTGTKTKYPWGNSNPDGTKCNYHNSYVGKTTLVGSYSEYNGLYDMAGNVWEWCWDWYHDDYYNEKIHDDPTGPEAIDLGLYKHIVRRGGAHNYNPDHLGCAVRNQDDPRIKIFYIGFRIVRNAE